MDRSQNFVLTTVRRALAVRGDGYWELLATAAGAPSSIARTEKALSADVLRLGAQGPAEAPSVVRERVDALCAWDPGILARLATTWLEPRDINDDPWWTAAWSAGLRHLKTLGVIDRNRADVAALAAEVALLWGDHPNQEISWRRWAEATKGRLSASIREMAQARIVEDNLTGVDIEGAPLSMLRLLRGRTHLLDASAIDVVSARALSCLARARSIRRRARHGDLRRTVA
jgi:hypothetical protein